MNCYYHPDRTSVAQCVVCKKNLCSECIIVKEGRHYCKDCLSTGEIEVGMDKIFIPVLACGLLGGILSVAPFISALNCVFCLWIVLGGALAVYLVKRFNNIKGKISTGKAAITGGLTGLVASVIVIIVQFATFEYTDVFQGMLETTEFQDALREAGMTGENFTGIILVLGAVISVVLFVIFGALGGILSNEIKK